MKTPIFFLLIINFFAIHAASMEETSKVLELFTTTGVVVRTPSIANGFGAEKKISSYNPEKSLDYEYNQALQSNDGVSASFLIKDIPLDAYTGNTFFLIYDPSKLNVLLATYIDGSTHGPAKDNLILDGNCSRLRGTGKKDYSKYKSCAANTVEGIKTKVEKNNQVRLGLLVDKGKCPTCKAFKGFTSFGHTELMVRLKDNCSIEEALIGIGIHSYVNFVPQEVKEYFFVDKKLPFYLYDPMTGFSKIPEEYLNDETEYLDKIKDQFFRKSKLQNWNFDADKEIIKPLNDRESSIRWDALNTLLFSFQIDHIEDIQKLYDLNILSYIKSNQLKEFNIKNKIFMNMLIRPYLINLMSAVLFDESLDIVKKIEHESIALIALKILFSSKFENIELFKQEDERGFSLFCFETPIKYGSDGLMLKVKVFFEDDGKVKIHGFLNDIAFAYHSQEINIFPDGFLGDEGALNFLNTIYAKKLAVETCPK